MHDCTASWILFSRAHGAKQAADCRNRTPQIQGFCYILFKINILGSFIQNNYKFLIRTVSRRESWLSWMNTLEVLRYEHHFTDFIARSTDSEHSIKRDYINYFRHSVICARLARVIERDTMPIWWDTITQRRCVSEFRKLFISFQWSEKKQQKNAKLNAIKCCNYFSFKFFFAFYRFLATFYWSFGVIK